MGLEGFDKRLRKAFRAWEDRIGRDVSQTELGEIVGERLGEKKPISQQSVARWFAGTLPEYPRLEALADVLGVYAGWLAFGDPAAPATGAPRDQDRPAGPGG